MAIWRMRVACWITRATYIQNMGHILFIHCNNGYHLDMKAVNTCCSLHVSCLCGQRVIPASLWTYKVQRISEIYEFYYVKCYFGATCFDFFWIIFRPSKVPIRGWQCLECILGSQTLTIDGINCCKSTCVSRFYYIYIYGRWQFQN